MDANAGVADPAAQGPPPGVTLTPLTPPGASGPPPGVTLTPLPGASATPPPAPTAAAPDFGANPNGEGTYQMFGPQGRKAVPYSQVDLANKSGMTLTPADRMRYSKDLAADPKINAQADQLAGDTNSPQQNVGRGALKDVLQVPNTVLGWLDSITNKLQPSTNPKEDLKGGAENLENRAMPGITEPVHGAGEMTGAFASELAQWLYGEGEARAAFEGLPLAQRLKKLASEADYFEKHPNIAKVAASGLRNTAQGIGAGAQSLLHGASPKEAAENGLLAGGGGAVLDAAAGGASGIVKKLTPETRTIEGVQTVISKTPPVTPQAAAGAEAYAKTAQEIGRGHLEDLNSASAAPHTTWGIDEAGNFTEPKTSVSIPPVDVDEALKNTHDFTGVSNAMVKANDAAYNALDTATNGEFRKANEAMKQARANMFNGTDNGAPEYKNAQARVEALFDSLDSGTQNKSGIDLQAIKNSWRQSYVLADIGKALDRSITGLPGDTSVSQAQRGLNGNVLSKQIRKIVEVKGIDNVRAALGPGRLENLQDLADATKTNAGRVGVNKAIRFVSEALPVAYLGFKAGEHFGGIPGGMVGAAGAEAGILGVKRVYDAVRTNPRIGKNLLFAIESGANPKNYAPLIAAMIANDNNQQQSGEEK